MTITFLHFFKIFLIFKGVLHPRCWHPCKGAATEAVLLCEEVLESFPGRLVRGGEGAALLKEDLDGGHSCFELWFFGVFASEIQVFITFPAPGSNDNHFFAFF